MVRISVGAVDVPKEIFLRGKRIDSLWMPGINNPYLARHLIAPVRTTIAFWSIDGVPVKLKADLIGVSAGEFLALNRMLWATPNAAVDFCRRYGLPASASVKLNQRFFCPSCARWIVSLPCICCWQGRDDDPDV